MHVEQKDLQHRLGSAPVFLLIRRFFPVFSGLILYFEVNVLQNLITSSFVLFFSPQEDAGRQYVFLSCLINVIIV